MATQASPSAPLHPHHLVQRQQPNGHGPVSVPVPGPLADPPKTASYLTSVNENTWLKIGTSAILGRPSVARHEPRHSRDCWLRPANTLPGRLSEVMGDVESAIGAYQRALSFSPNCVPAMAAIGHILRIKDQYPAAVDFFNKILRIEPNDGETWSSLGRSYRPSSSPEHTSSRRYFDLHAPLCCQP